MTSYYAYHNWLVKIDAPLTGRTAVYIFDLNTGQRHNFWADESGSHSYICEYIDTVFEKSTDKSLGFPTLMLLSESDRKKAIQIFAPQVPPKTGNQSIHNTIGNYDNLDKNQEDRQSEERKRARKQKEQQEAIFILLIRTVIITFVSIIPVAFICREIFGAGGISFGGVITLTIVAAIVISFIIPYRNDRIF